jgi:hypothetical protein
LNINLDHLLGIDGLDLGINFYLSWNIEKMELILKSDVIGVAYANEGKKFGFYHQVIKVRIKNGRTKTI